MKNIVIYIIVLFSIGIEPAISDDGSILSDTLHWYSIIPPFMAVLLAFITKRLLISLGAAIVVGAFLASLNQTDSTIFNTLSNTSGYFFDNITNTWNLTVLSFVIVILAMISVIIVSGGLKGLVSHLLPFANTPRSSKLITAFAGFIVFIDDYANTMIVGSAMRPITDQYRVSREKLAFIIDATSAPVAGLAVISTWIGFEVGLFGDVSQSLSLGKNGYSMFFDALAFRFYCIIMLVFVIISIITERDFGPMAAAEQRAMKTGALLAADAQPATAASFSLVEVANDVRIKARTALIPFFVLFTVLLVGFWFDGNGQQHFQQNWFSPFSLQVWQEVISNIKNSTTILLISAIIGLISAVVISITLAKTPLQSIQKAILIGVKSSLLPIMILLLAWSLKSVCDDLGTGKYMVETLSPYMSPLWFPALLFFVAAITAFGTGTSWGTMSILIPIAIPLAYELDMQSYGLITIISLGAVLDGAIFGDHCSPISDTTIMSSIASNCDHLHHVKTQIPYSLVVAATALLAGYLPAAAGLSPLTSYGISILLLILILFKLGRKIDNSIAKA